VRIIEEKHKIFKNRSKTNPKKEEAQTKKENTD